MKRPKVPELPLPQYDYGLALQTAVSWLGDRYLLAQPVVRRPVEHAPYFTETRPWHEPRRQTGPGSRRH
jgi:hypothetical protein